MLHTGGWGPWTVQPGHEGHEEVSVLHTSKDGLLPAWAQRSTYLSSEEMVMTRSVKPGTRFSSFTLAPVVSRMFLITSPPWCAAKKTTVSLSQPATHCTLCGGEGINHLPFQSQVQTAAGDTSA